MSRVYPRIAGPSLALVLVFVLGACRTAPLRSDPPLVQPGAPGEPSRVISADKAVDLSRVQHTAADVRFMQNMIGHHAQAMEMTALLASRTASADMRKLALRIDVSQTDEITMMRDWLQGILSGIALGMAMLPEEFPVALTIFLAIGSWRLAPSAVQWALFASGPFTFGSTTVTIFAKSRPDIANPDLQFLFMPGILPRSSASKKELIGIEAVKGIRFSVSAAKPKSRGRLRARSSDISEHPSINPGYLTAREDMETLKAGLRLGRRIFSAPALSPYVHDEVFPGKAVQSDEEIEIYIRATGHTAYHPAGTCKMGKDPMAVVDPSLRVHDIDGLRVADASIMPIVTTGNINAPTTMIGEKASDLIRRDAATVAA